MSSAMEIGAQIKAAGEEVVRGVNAATGKALGDLTAALEALALAKYRAEEPTEAVAGALGEGHPGLEAIVGNTVPVTEGLERISEHVQAAISAIPDLSGVVDNLGFVYDNIGSQLMRGGGQ